MISLIFVVIVVVMVARMVCFWLEWCILAILMEEKSRRGLLVKSFKMQVFVVISGKSAWLAQKSHQSVAP